VLGLRVIHPLPSALNAALVVALAIVAGASLLEAGLLGLAMLGFQGSIGALNDVVDADRDRLTKPAKPIPAGVISGRGATVVAMAGAAVGLVISARFGLPVLILGAAGYGCGLLYDLVMRRRGQGWVCFAGAFPLLLAWTWMAVAGSLPPGWPLLLPLAALAGPTIHLANSLVDLDADEQAGVTSLATSLGEDRAPLVLTMLTASIHVLAWAILIWLADLPTAALAAATAGTLCAGLGVSLSWRPAMGARERGWLLQAIGIALLAVAWVAAAGA
jgi:geranylgeranylglycerol-phosphate geranylgeranyltransferase